MGRRVYRIEAGNPATIAPATEMVPCDWCGIKITPPNPRTRQDADDVVMHQGVRICVGCGIRVGAVVCAVVDD